MIQMETATPRKKRRKKKKSTFQGLPFSYDALYVAQEGLCFYCFCQMDRNTWRPNNNLGYTRDHLFPVSAGHTLEANVVLACRTCNNVAKGDNPPSRADIQRFVKLYSSVFTTYFERHRHSAITEWLENDSILGKLVGFFGKPNIPGLVS